MSRRPFVGETLGPLRASKCFLIIASDTFINSLEDPSDSEHVMLLSQVLAAREAKKPVIVLWIKDVSALNRTKLRNVLKDMNVLGELEIKGDDAPTEEDMQKIVKLMEEAQI